MTVVLALVLGLGCSSAPEEAPSAGSEQQLAKPEITIYSGRGESLVGPLFDRIPDDAPFTGLVRQDCRDGHTFGR